MSYRSLGALIFIPLLIRCDRSLRRLAVPGPANAIYANANGVKTVPIKARDDAQTFVWLEAQRRVAPFSPHSLRVAIKKALRGVAKP
ncbi:hypothetical protein [Polaromonas sp. P5_D5]